MLSLSVVVVVEVVDVQGVLNNLVLHVTMAIFFDFVRGVLIINLNYRKLQYSTKSPIPVNEFM